MWGVSVDLSDRYGTRRPRQRIVLLVLSVALAVVFGSWLAWVTWFHSSPSVSSDLGGFDVVDEHTVTVTASIDLDEDAEDPSCRVRALAADHTTVGELRFTPQDGRNEVDVRTEREATSVDWVGCTAADQSRSR